MTDLTYEASVKWLRNQPDKARLVELCYFDEDNHTAAKRFAKSEEFTAVQGLLSPQLKKYPQKILDVGCGNGIATYAFASLGHHVTAVDPDLSDDVGLQATARLQSVIDFGSITPVQAVAESLPFDDATFDIIYARQALHHFADLCQGTAECARVLKPGGVFLPTREHVVSNEEQKRQFLDDHLLHQLHGGENAYPLDAYKLAIHQADLRKLRTFAPFDTVINHYPATNSDIQTWLSSSLRAKIGSLFAGRLSQVSMLEVLYRYRLSKTCQSPGRLYSFLCIK